MVVVPRAPTPTIEQQEVFRPVAAPVDTYIRAPDPAPSSLHQVASSLQNFSRDIRGMFQAREAADEEAARLRGEAQFFKDNQVGYAEAVRTGKIPAFASKPFMQAYKEAEGKLIGARLASQMQLEYQTWDGRNSQDPANFDTFMADFLKRNLTQDDPDVLKGAMPYIYQTVNNGYSQRTQDAADATYNGGLNAGIAVSSIAIDDASTLGLTSGQGTDYDALWEALVANRGSALSSGIRQGDYDNKLVDLIAAKAVEERDPAILALLDRALPGTDNPISASPYGREVKAKTIDALETVNYQAENAAYAAQTRRDAALKDQLTAFAIETISSDPNAVLPDNFWAAFSKVEPEARVKVQAWRNAILNGQEEDVEAIRDLNYAIMIRGENATEVIERGMEAGVIRKASTLKSLYDMGQETPIWQETQAYKLGLRSIQQAAAMGGDLEAFDPDYVSPAASAASLDFELSMRAWAKTPEGSAAIQGGDMATIATVIAKTQAAITAGFDLSPEAPAAYVQPEGVTQALEAAGFEPNPLAPTQGQVNEETAAADAFAASPEGQMQDWNGQVPDLNALPAEEQTLLREWADSQGIDPQLILDETARQVDEIIRGVEAGYSIEELLSNPPQIEPAPGPQSEVRKGDYHPSGAPSAALQGGALPQAGSGGTADAPGFIAPMTNTADLRPEVISKYAQRRVPASIRLNNMGGISITGAQANIPNTWAARQPGFVGVVARPANEGGWYAQYATPEDGIRAASNLLIRYGEDGVDTPNEIANKWAVGSTAAYARTTTRFLNAAGFDVTTDTPLNLNDPAVRIAILRAKSAHESGFGQPIYYDELYERAVGLNIQLASN